MKKISLFLTLAILALGTVAYGQGYTFRVLANKGANQIKAGDSWENLKTGATLKANDEIKVGDDAYLGLMHSGGRTLEWRKAGTYKVADLASEVSAGKSVGAKYADFLASKMTAESKVSRMQATGAVTRGGDDNQINVYLPKSVSIYNSNAVVRWDALEGDNITYKILIRDMFSETLVSAETNQTFYNLDLNNEKIQEAIDGIVLLTVTTVDDENVYSEDIMIKKLDNDEMQRVDSGLGELMTDIQEESALNKYILAGFYEDNNLLIDALTNYEKAIELAPEVDTFKEAYDDFLIRNGLKDVN